MKTFILKYEVRNRINFPVGTIVAITDDDNTKFTVVEGELKGEKGCIADGLKGWLIEDTAENRKLVENFLTRSLHIKLLTVNLNDEWREVPTAIL